MRRLALLRGLHAIEGVGQLLARSTEDDAEEVGRAKARARQHEDRLLRVQLVADFVQAASQAEARQNLSITIKLRNGLMELN